MKTPTIVNKGVHPLGGALWQLENFDSRNADHFAIVQSFLTEHPHDDFAFTFNDAMMRRTITVICPLASAIEMIQMVCKSEFCLINYLGENPLRQSYVLGVYMKHHNIVDGIYTYVHGRLIKQ